MVPKEFFVTSGKAFSATSELNAFDQALKNAGIAHCNLVQVTSILPKGYDLRKDMVFSMGSFSIYSIKRPMVKRSESSGLIQRDVSW